MSNIIRDSQKIAADIVNSSNNVITDGWWDIENRRREKFRFYYKNYSIKQFIIDFFLIIITYGLIIIFFFYRHKKHLEYRERVRNGEFKEEDFMEDIDVEDGREKAKFLGKSI